MSQSASSLARQVFVASARSSGGQSLFVPSQFSATSQGPWDARHTAVLFVSAGQSLLTPLQLSATSHAPAEERQTAVLFASAGQAPLVPVQLSAVSQTPAEARHGVPTATLLHAVVLLLGWQDWQLFGAVFF